MSNPENWNVGSNPALTTNLKLIIMEHKIDENTIWFDTGQIVVSRKYIKKLFVEHKKGVFGTRVVEGPPIYFDELNQNQLALVNIMLTAQDVLVNELNCSEL